MSKTLETYETQIISVIKGKKLCRIKQIFGFYTGLSSSQFYELGLNKNENIISELEYNRTKTTTSMLLKWTDSDNPTLQVAAMKLLADDEDRQKLAQAYVEQKTTTQHTIAELENEVQASEYTEEEKAVMLNVARRSRGIYE